MKKLINIIVMASVAFVAFNAMAHESNVFEVSLIDDARNREIPVLIYEPKLSCNKASYCPVVLISGGYGESNASYSFVAKPLVDMGYLVVSIRHDLASDEDLPMEGNVFESRTPFWIRGSENLEFTINALSQKYKKFNWLHPILIGHSNGGDISVWFAVRHIETPAALVTLDHRRVPLPRSGVLHVLTIRGTDFPADYGVLPTPEEQKKFGIKVATVNGALHNEMIDSGPNKIKRQIVSELNRYLKILSL